MSKERELLYRWYKGAQDQVDFNELYDKTEELLAQPEKPPITQREMYQRGYAKAEQDLKRESMTGGEISQGFRADKDATNAESYWVGVALAEKHYGIGVGNE